MRVTDGRHHRSVTISDIPSNTLVVGCILDGENYFSYLIQENSAERGVPTFSVWYRAWLSGTVAWLSGTGCLVLPFVLLFIYVSIYDLTTQSATFPATSEGCRDVKENIIGIFRLKCISQGGTRKKIKSQC